MYGLIKDLKDCLKSVDLNFDKQEKRVDEAFRRLEGQSKEIFSLREELRKVKDRVIDTECVVEKTTDSIKQTQTKQQQIKEKTIDQEARGRRQNVIFHGIKESADENSDKCKQKVKDFIKEKCKLPDNVVIDVAHRLGPKKRDSVGASASKPRPMIAKFVSRCDRDTVMRTKNDLPQECGITPDFPREIRSARRVLIPKMIKAREEGHEAYIVYPCKLFIDGKEVERINPAKDP